MGPGNKVAGVVGLWYAVALAGSPKKRLNGANLVEGVMCDPNLKEGVHFPVDA